MNKRFLGLDYGDRTIGVAVSDPLGLMAHGVETIVRDRANALRASIRRLDELILEYDPIETIVLGFPKHMNNTEGERCAKTLAFKEKLERKFNSIPIVLWDERLSTVSAMRVIQTMPSRATPSHTSKDIIIDEIAATFILQGYMDYLSNTKKKVK